MSIIKLEIMKTVNLIFAVVLSLSVFTACDEDRDITNINKHVPAMAQAKVEQAYPNTRAEWEFNNNKLRAEVHTATGEDVYFWFQKDGTWIGIERDYHGKLSDAINAYVQNNYPNYYIDDVDIWETPDGTYYYELELDHKIKRDKIIKITEDGTIVP